MRIDAKKNFGTRECPSCGFDVAANENRCPVCDYEFPNAPAPSRPVAILGWIIAAIAIASILLMLVFGH